MSAALKELMQNNSFEKITVSDITEKCNIHRQTFYYHFQDRYQLLDWLIYNELIEPFITDITFDNIYDKFLVMINTMYHDKRFYQNALKINDVDLSNYLNKVTKDSFERVIKALSKESNVEIKDNTTNKLIAEFFGFGLSGVVINWAQHGMKETPEELAANLKKISIISKEIAISRAEKQ